MKTLIGSKCIENEYFTLNQWFNSIGQAKSREKICIPIQAVNDGTKRPQIELILGKFGRSFIRKAIVYTSVLKNYIFDSIDNQKFNIFSLREEGRIRQNWKGSTNCNSLINVIRKLHNSIFLDNHVTINRNSEKYGDFK